MIFWEEKALNDREHIFDYLSQYNPEAALKTDDIIETRTEALLTYPRMGVARPNLPGRLLIITEISMIVVYKIEGNSIRVLRVLHQKQQFP